MLREQAAQKAALWFRTRIAARVDDFAAAAGSTGCFTSACGLDVTTGVTSTLVTQLVKQAKRASVSRARCNHCDCQQSWNDYTTHREISMDIGSGKVHATPEPQHVRAAKDQLQAVARFDHKRCLGGFAGRPACGGASGTAPESQVFTNSYRRGDDSECGDPIKFAAQPFCRR